EICQSQELRAFLSQQNVALPQFATLATPSEISSNSSTVATISDSQQSKSSGGFMKHIYQTVAEGIDDIFSGPSMLDDITERLGKQVMQFSMMSEEESLGGSTVVVSHQDSPSEAGSSSGGFFSMTRSSTPPLATTA